MEAEVRTEIDDAVACSEESAWEEVGELTRFVLSDGARK
jgi:TPP-dependent pyruvate/acetoin dehydrogenase alpha subunit